MYRNISEGLLTKVRVSKSSCIISKMSTSACEMEERCPPGDHFTTLRQLKAQKVSYRQLGLLESLLSQAVACVNLWEVGLAYESSKYQFYEMPKLWLLPVCSETPFSLQKGMFEFRGNYSGNSQQVRPSSILYDMPPAEMAINS